jgi:P4 family phage/plasmid primase-like protien
MGIELSVFGANSHLSKTIRLTEDGKLDKGEQGHNPTMCKRARTKSAADLAALIQNLESFHALALGVMRDGMGEISDITVGAVDATTARSLDNFLFRPGQPAWMLLDRDKDGPDFEDVFPVLTGIMRLKRASTSAGLNVGGNSGGLHLFIGVQDGDDIERALKVAHERCWLAGHGRYLLSKAGSLLDRSIIDVSVGSPERLVYEGPPVLGPGLTQDAEMRRPIAIEGELLDTRIAFPDLTPEELAQLKALKDAAREDIKPDAEKAEKAYREERVVEIVASGVSREEAERRMDAYKALGVLSHDHVLTFATLGTATVGQAMADPERYHGQALADPVEGPGYGRTTAKIYLKQGRRKINSKAHGDILYSLPDRTVKEMFGDLIVTMPDGTFTKVLPAETIIGPTGERTELPERTVTYRTIFGAAPAQAQAPGPTAAAPAQAPGPQVPGPRMARGDWMAPDAEDTLALDFVNSREGEIRYITERGKWLRWDGQRWAADETTAVYDLIRKHVRQLAFQMAATEQKKVATAQKVAAVERLARTDQRIATTGDAWDADSWMLNTPGGIVDLRSGELIQAAPEFLCTKMTAVAPDGDCPTWKAFLDRSLGGDADLIGYLQRILGYCLTGDVREHELYFLYGRGANGKSVFLNTVSYILADYSQTAPMEALMDKKYQEHPTELAGLQGARIAVASETEQGRRWAEARVKSITGGEPITARFMRQDYFRFMPQFKLLIAGNHKPGLRSVDEAIRRRFRLIPFTITIPAHERDKALAEKLRAEAGGILTWMIEGCLEWQRSGLQTPSKVTAATDEYLSDEDAISSWLEDKCERGADYQTSRTELFASWQLWAEKAREPIGTMRQFLDALRTREFEEYKLNKVRGFQGLRLLPMFSDADIDRAIREAELAAAYARAQQNPPGPCPVNLH